MEKATTQAKLKFLKYVPVLTLPFYMEYQKKILHEFKYENKISEIYGFINYNQNFLRFEEYSFNIDNINIKTGNIYYVKGLLCHFSTYEDFLNCSELNNINNKIKSNILKFLKNEKENYCFVLLCFGDLKNYVFHYNLIEINYPLNFKISTFSKMKKDSEDNIYVNTVTGLRRIHNKENLNFINLIGDFSEDNIQKNDDNNCLCDVFFDGIAKFDNFSNLLKTRIFYLIMNQLNMINNDLSLENYKEKANKYFESGKNIKMYLIKEDPKLCFQNNDINSVSKLIIENNSTFILKIGNLKVEDFKNIEINPNNNIKVDLKNTFDPYSVCENSVDLNINLMKWRMAPNLNIEKIRKTKFLLIGAGTLGCHVSRNLLGWGARNIHFIDSGYISYSNPVRQSLYSFNDAKEGPNLKAEIAAKKLKEIFPSVNSEGHSFQIPLPGRKLIDENSRKSFFEKIEKLENLIKENDVIFLLTDSRESRWFPTVLAKNHGKICVTAAIGFDTFVVMRHGFNNNIYNENSKNRDVLHNNTFGEINNNIGCYFCNDIVSPVDTSMNRTLDQQCTISRPGISGICSGFAAEMGISLIQKGSGMEDEIPEIIRGNIRDFNFLKLKLDISKNENIMKNFNEDRENFLVNVMNTQDYLEEISGVTKLMQEVNLDDIEYNDEDDF